MERLTKRTPEGIAYLANVKDGEQAIEGAKNTLECVFEAWQMLAAYEETGYAPSQLAEILKFAQAIVRDSWPWEGDKIMCNAAHLKRAMRREGES